MLKYIIVWFDLKLPDGVIQSEVELYFNIGMVSLIILSCLLNVFGYLIAILLIKFYDIDKKYPKYKWLFNYFYKSSLFWLIIESLIGFGFLIALIILGFLPLFNLKWY